MSATNSTTNYALPIFIGTDKPAWLVDWNGAMTDIDAAIKGVDTDVQGAITSISGLSSTVASHTSSISTISGQITVITTNLNTATGNINTINSLIGNGTPTTTDETLIGAINELHADQGDLADLTTPAVSLVAAINAISSGGAVVASAVSFDNTGTSIVATNVQAAIVELSQGGGVSASGVSYDNTASGLTATNAQAAIDEVDGKVDALENNIADTAVDLTPYTSGSPYTALVNGYVALDSSAGLASCGLYDSTGTLIGTSACSVVSGSAQSSLVYVKKGMKLSATTSGGGTAKFIPLK